MSTIRKVSFIQYLKHCDNVMAGFDFNDESLVDLVFVCKNKEMVNCHKILFSAVSNTLKDILMDNHDPVTFVYLPDINYEHMIALKHFLYEGYARLNTKETKEFKDVLLLLGIIFPGASIRFWDPPAEILRKFDRPTRPIPTADVTADVPAQPVERRGQKDGQAVNETEEATANSNNSEVIELSDDEGDGADNIRNRKCMRLPTSLSDIVEITDGSELSAVKKLNYSYKKRKTQNGNANNVATPCKNISCNMQNNTIKRSPESFPHSNYRVENQTQNITNDPNIPGPSHSLNSQIRPINGPDNSSSQVSNQNNASDALESESQNLLNNDMQDGLNEPLLSYHENVNQNQTALAPSPQRLNNLHQDLSVNQNQAYPPSGPQKLNNFHRNIFGNLEYRSMPNLQNHPNVLPGNYVINPLYSARSRENLNSAQSSVEADSTRQSPVQLTSTPDLPFMSPSYQGLTGTENPNTTQGCPPGCSSWINTSSAVAPLSAQTVPHPSLFLQNKRNDSGHVSSSSDMQMGFQNTEYNHGHVNPPLAPQDQENLIPARKRGRPRKGFTVPVAPPRMERRNSITEQDINTLEHYYKTGRYLGPEMQRKLALSLGLAITVVRKWYLKREEQELNYKKKSLLESVFKNNQRPNPKEKLEISEMVGVPVQIVSNWFNKRRMIAKMKAQQSKLSQYQIEVLEKVYLKCEFQGERRQKQLAKQLGIPSTACIDWFVKRRQQDDYILVE